MASGETEVEMVERHIRAGERHVANQQEIVAFLQSHNYPSQQAEELLVNLTDLLKLHREHLVRLKAA